MRMATLTEMLGTDRGDYVSLWLEEALAAEQAPPTSPEPLPGSADFVIVGGGFTGLWTAIRLLEREPSASVCLVESRYCGFGASGRNGGIAEGSWAKLPAMRRLYGDHDAARLAVATDAGLDELIRFCAEHSIDAELRRHGNAWVATNQAQLGAWEKACQAAQDLGHDIFEPLDHRRAAEMTGSPLALGGVFERNCATVQPAKLVRGLRRVALDRGAQIHESTAMTGLRRDGSRTVVETGRGEIRTDRVVLAMNAWAARMKPVASNIFVTSSDIIATAPGVTEAIGGPLNDGIALSDSRRLILYWRSTPNGRIVFGKGGGWMSVANRVDGRFTGRSALADSVTSRFRRLYPDLRQTPIEYTWNGPIDYSSTGLPYLGPLTDDRPNVLIGIGFSGMGVVPCVLAGQVLASLALEADDEYSSLPTTRRWPNRLPPEPLRSIGAPLVRMAIARREQLYDAEARPSPLLSAIAALDPTAAPTES